jgi:hypothetical protein
VLHHVRDVQEAVLVEGQSAGHRVGFETSQKTPFRIETLHARFCVHVLLPKVGHQNFVFPGHHKSNRNVEFSISRASGSPGQHLAGCGRRFVLGQYLRLERRYQKRSDAARSRTQKIPASHCHRATRVSGKAV